MLSPKQKQKIAEAARKGLEKSPYANMPVDQGLYVKPGEVITLRENLERQLASEKFYELVEKYIARSGMTFDQYLETLDYKGPAAGNKPRLPNPRP